MNYVLLNSCWGCWIISELNAERIIYLDTIANDLDKINVKELNILFFDLGGETFNV